MRKVRNVKATALRRVECGFENIDMFKVSTTNDGSKNRGFDKKKIPLLKGNSLKRINNFKAQSTAKDGEKIINTKSIIICDDDKVKRYAELVKNSDMHPIAVVCKNNGAHAPKKLTAKTVVLCIVVGLILGFVNGFLGGGGGMLCVPLLVFALGLTDKRAHATAILIMLPISLASFAVYACSMRIEWELALWVVLGSVAGGALGSILLKKLSNSWLRAIFALIMIVAGLRMIL